MRKPIDTTVYSQRDGAVWNFTAGHSGTFETSIMLNKGFKGASITLNDRWFQPIDNQGIETAMFTLEIPASGKISSETLLEKETWHSIKFVWNGTQNKNKDECLIYINNHLISKRLILKNKSVHGISYARFRSGSRSPDKNGMFIEMVHAKIN